jgi:hypothetical protein
MVSFNFDAPTNKTYDGFEMVWVSGEAGMPNGMWVGKYEVTYRQLTRVLGAHKTQQGGTGERDPADSVSKDEVDRFFAMLNARSNTAPAVYHYRLLTLSEYNYVARNARINEEVSVCATWGEKKLGWKSSADRVPQPIGSAGEDEYGFCDLNGNLHEWVMYQTNMIAVGSAYCGIFNGAPSLSRCLVEGMGFRVVLAPSLGLVASLQSSNVVETRKQ